MILHGKVSNGTSMHLLEQIYETKSIVGPQEQRINSTTIHNKRMLNSFLLYLSALTENTFA